MKIVVWFSVASFTGVLLGSFVTSSQDRYVNLSECVVDKIEFSEKNRKGYFPGQRERVLHWLVMNCVKENVWTSDFIKAKERSNKYATRGIL